MILLPTTIESGFCVLFLAGLLVLLVYPSIRERRYLGDFEFHRYHEDGLDIICSLLGTRDTDGIFSIPMKHDFYENNPPHFAFFAMFYPR